MKATRKQLFLVIFNLLGHIYLSSPIEGHSLQDSTAFQLSAHVEIDQHMTIENSQTLANGNKKITLNITYNGLETATLRSYHTQNARFGAIKTPETIQPPILNTISQSSLDLPLKTNAPIKNQRIEIEIKPIDTSENPIIELRLESIYGTTIVYAS